MNKFTETYWEMREAVEHIENAISGSEIWTDLDFIKKKVEQLRKMER